MANAKSFSLYLEQGIYNKAETELEEALKIKERIWDERYYACNYFKSFRDSFNQQFSKLSEKNKEL